MAPTPWWRRWRSIVSRPARSSTGWPSSMQLYNTLTRREETFAPSEDKLVRMYACGLTVYARGHIGNFRTFVAIDVLRRTLEYLEGCRIRQVVNFMDVDDRTIAGALKTGT